MWLLDWLFGRRGDDEDLDALQQALDDIAADGGQPAEGLLLDWVDGGEGPSDN